MKGMYEDIVQTVEAHSIVESNKFQEQGFKILKVRENNSSNGFVILLGLPKK